MEFSFPVPGRNEISGQFANKWYSYINRFHCYQDQNGHSKSSLLFHYGAQTMKEFQLTNKISLEEFSKLSCFLETLEAHCLFQIVLCFIRHLFFTHCRRSGSTVEDFYTELRLLSEWCCFDENIDDNIIRNQLIRNIQDKSARDLLISVSSLTAKNVMDVCSIAEKQGSIVSSDTLNMYIMDQQESFLSAESTMKKDCVWSSFQEMQTEITQGLNHNTLFRLDSQNLTVSDRQKSIHHPDFSGKQNSYPSFEYPIAEQESDSSFFQNNKTVPVDISYQQNNEPVTNLTSQYSQASNYALPYQESCQPQSNPVVEHIADVESTNSKKCPPTQGTNDTCKISAHNSNITNNISNDEASDDLLMTFLDTNGDSNLEVKELNTPSVENVAPKNDVIEVPPVFISQQKAILKTSQMTKATGQCVDVYSCNFCVFGCAGKSAMEKHVMQVHNSLKCFVCTSCNAKFPFKEKLESHVRVKHLNVEEHKCQICDMIFASQSNLFLHLQGHAESRTVSCRVCSAMFTTEGLLSEHMSSVHPDTDRWICKVCDETFTLRRLLSDHMSEMHKDGNNEQMTRRFMCKLCDITFTDKKSSDMHKKKFHKKKHAKQFPCDQCDHICSSNANLISHRRIHTGEKPFMCEVCGKEFSQSSSLDKHTRIHTGEKPYKCQYCDLSFNTSSNRLVHERNHRKERPYVCEQCGKTFRNSYELKVHIVTHNEFRTKRFICHCGAAFDTKRKLKRHEICHTGQKPYKCEICGAGFTRSENVKGHQKSQACRNRVLKLQ